MLSVFYEMFSYGMYSIFISLVHFVWNILRVLHCSGGFRGRSKGSMEPPFGFSDDRRLWKPDL